MATRQGSAKSGISGHIRGWNIGARVEIRDRDGTDVVQVFQTAGSNGGKADVLLCEYTDE